MSIVRDAKEPTALHAQYGFTLVQRLTIHSHPNPCPGPGELETRAFRWSLGWGVKLEFGVGCKATSAAFPSTIMEVAFGRLHSTGAGAFGARPSVVDSILVEGGG